MYHFQHLVTYLLSKQHSSARSSEKPPPTQAPHDRPSTRHTCLRSSLLRPTSATFSSFVIPAVLGTEAGDVTGDVAHTLGAGDASGVARRLGEGESVPTREVRTKLATRVRAGDAMGANAEAGEKASRGVSSVTGIGTDGDPGAGSSNAAHGFSPPAAPPQPTDGVRACIYHRYALKLVCVCERNN